MAFQLSPETGTSTLTQTLEGTWCSLLEYFRVESRDKWRLVPPLDRQNFICVAESATCSLVLLVQAFL